MISAFTSSKGFQSLISGYFCHFIEDRGSCGKLVFYPMWYIYSQCFLLYWIIHGQATTGTDLSLWLACQYLWAQTYFLFSNEDHVLFLFFTRTRLVFTELIWIVV